MSIPFFLIFPIDPALPVFSDAESDGLFRIEAVQAGGVTGGE